MAAFAVLHRDAAGNDCAVALETLAHLAERSGREAKLGLQVLDGARARSGEVPQHPCAVVGCRFGLRKRGAAERIGRARAIGIQEQRLPAVELGLEDVRTPSELAAPAPFRLRPRRETLLRRVVRLLMRRSEQARDRGVLREREQASVLQECMGVIERPQLPVGSEPAVEKALRAELR